MSDFFSSPSGSALLGVAAAVISSGLIIGLFKVKPERRKINAEAITEGANAASMLTGQALAMVKEAKDSADRANRRADAAEKKADDMARRADSAISQSQECAREVQRLREQLSQWKDQQDTAASYGGPHEPEGKELPDVPH